MLAGSEGASIVAMVKPQFELEPKLVPGGVVRDDALRARAVAQVVAAAEALGFTYISKEPPVHRPAGNREVFVHLKAR